MRTAGQRLLYPSRSRDVRRHGGFVLHCGKIASFSRLEQAATVIAIAPRCVRNSLKNALLISRRMRIGDQHHMCTTAYDSSIDSLTAHTQYRSRFIVSMCDTRRRLAIDWLMQAFRTATEKHRSFSSALIEGPTKCNKHTDRLDVRTSHARGTPDSHVRS